MKAVLHLKIVLQIQCGFILIFFSFVLLACNPKERTSDEIRTDGKDELVKGKKLYELNCLDCHKGPGVKDGNQFGKLFDRLPEPPEEYFSNYVRDSKKLKKDKDGYALAVDRAYKADYEHLFGEFSEADMQELIKYIKTTF